MTNFQMNHVNEKRQHHALATRRNGAILPLMCVILIVLMTFAMMSINIIWMSLARTEAQSAADFASIGALQYVTDIDSPNALTEARQLGADILNRNEFAGRNRNISPDRIRFGFLLDPSVHNPQFVENNFQITAVKIDPSPTGTDTEVPVFLGNLFGDTQVDIMAKATSTYSPIELILCLDASRSMTLGGDGRISSNEPPLPGSRWFRVKDSVSNFLDKVERINPNIRIGLVTFGGGNQSRPTPSPLDLTFARREVDMQAAADGSDITDVLDRYVSYPALGYGTSIYDGIEHSVDLMNEQADPSLPKTVILLSDGSQAAVNRPAPELAAQRSASHDITIHTISYKNNDNPDMDIIAATTGGEAYRASKDSELEEAFSRILQKLRLRLAD